MEPPQRGHGARPSSSLSVSTSSSRMPPPQFVPSTMGGAGRQASSSGGATRQRLGDASARLRTAASSPTNSLRSQQQQQQQPMSTSTRARRLQDLVLATVPSARPRRSEAADVRRVQERDAVRSRLVALAEDILGSSSGSGGKSASRPEEEAMLVAQLKRSIKQHQPAEGNSAAIRLETAISRLRRQQDMTQDLPALLELLEQLSFSVLAKPYAPSHPSPYGSDAGTYTAHPRSSLAPPDVYGDTRSGSEAGRGGIDSRRNSAAASLHRRPSSRAMDSQSPLPDMPDMPNPLLSPPSPAATRGSAHTKEQPTAERTSSNHPHKQAETDAALTDPSVPRATLLERWRSNQGRQLIAESDLLQDVLYLFQGINGRHVGFEEAAVLPSNDMGETRDPERTVRVCFYGDAAKQITPPTKHLVHRIAELGRLYKAVAAFLVEQSQRENAGLIMQSLCHFLSSEMTDYYRLVAILEAQMKQHPIRRAQVDRENDNLPSSSPGRLTLKRIAVWTEDVLLRMRLTSTIIESCKDAHGGGIVSLIHSYTFHGDPLICNYTARILNHVSKPFFHTLSKWIFEGELQDPFKEFFVELNEDTKAAGGLPAWDESSNAANPHLSSVQLEHAISSDSSSQWLHQFRFRPEMLPSFLDEGFGRKIFSTGKSLHFIRFSCGDADWMAARKTMRGVVNQDGTQLSKDGHDAPFLRYADLPGFERTIDDAYAIASSRLLDIFLGKFKLLEHLRALKDYLMLARGDFVDLLMESIGPSLDRPASTLFRHNLTASLETSIRGSNSQHDDPDIIDRLDARILDFNEGDLGWDSFTLEYRVDEPVNTVLDAHAMLGYQVVFSHLWKVKRVELALDASWERLLLAANTFRRALPRQVRRRPRRTGQASAMDDAVNTGDGDSTGDRALIALAHLTLGQLGEVMHFMKQLQGFVNLEVIEYSWNDLTQLFASHAAGRRQLDLDELIQSHRAYLNMLIAKVLLRSGSSKDKDKRGGAAQDHLALEVKANLDTMLAFALAVDDLAAFVTDRAARVDLAAAKQSGNGDGNFDPDVGDNVDHAALAALRRRLATHHGAFSQSTHVILARLEKHSNLVVRDLATRVNFNSFYQTSAAAATGGASGRRTGSASAMATASTAAGSSL